MINHLLMVYLGCCFITPKCKRTQEMALVIFLEDVFSKSTVSAVF